MCRNSMWPWYMREGAFYGTSLAQVTDGERTVRYRH